MIVLSIDFDVVIFFILLFRLYLTISVRFLWWLSDYSNIRRESLWYSRYDFLKTRPFRSYAKPQEVK